MGISFGVDASARQKIVRMFRKSSDKSETQGMTASQVMATDLVRFVQQFASGRPGPNVVTGDYRSRIRIMSRSAGRTFSTVDVGTDHPAARRLEEGFVGIDSLGRHYQQPAFPHWKPGILALGVSKKKYAAILREALPK